MSAGSVMKCGWMRGDFRGRGGYFVVWQAGKQNGRSSVVESVVRRAGRRGVVAGMVLLLAVGGGRAGAEDSATAREPVVPTVNDREVVEAIEKGWIFC